MDGHSNLRNELLSAVDVLSVELVALWRSRTGRMGGCRQVASNATRMWLANKMRQQGLIPKPLKSRLDSILWRIETALSLDYLRGVHDTSGATAIKVTIDELEQCLIEITELKEKPKEVTP